MKLVCVFLLAAFMQVSAASYAQQTKLNLSAQNLSIEKVLGQIEDQTDFSFFYNNQEVDLTKEISLNSKDQTIEEVLEFLMQESGLNYTINNKLIIIHKAPENRFSELKEQARKITGKVKDVSGAPLPGVTVLIKGSTTGTITDFDGNYMLPDVTEGTTLVFSFVGMKPEEVVVGKTATIDVVLEENFIGLEEVVAIGYGTQKKKDLTSSIATISADEIANQTVGSAMASVQGRFAGVQITNSGSPGSSPSIRIRGTGSTFNSNPLYVVDGVIVNDISYLGPNDIETMSVLRDASASAIYGVQAANGVILVTTKKGSRDGDVEVSFNSYVGVKKASQLMEMVGTGEWITMWNERMEYSGSPEDKLDPSVFTANTNWFDEVLENSITHSEDINIRGGGKKTAFNIGLNHLKEDGLIKDDNYSKLGLRANYDIFINDNIDMGMSLVVSSTQANPAPNGLLLDAFRAIPLYAPTNENGEFTDPSMINGFTPDNQSNPAAKLFYNHRWSNKINAFANTYVKIKFLKDFEFKSTIGTNPTFRKSISYTPKYEVSATQMSPYNWMTKNYSNNLSVSWDNILTWEKLIKNVHQIKAMAGYTYREYKTDYLNGKAEDIVDLPEINSSFLFLSIGKASTNSTIVASDGGSKNVQIGYMGRLNYDYKNKYLANFTMRADASSKFPANNRWGYFPSVGLGWVVSEESFMADTGIDFLKVRAGWGLLGNANIPSNLYQLTTSNGTPVIFGPDQNSGLGPVSPSVTIKKSFNPDLKWEVVDETNIGIDMHTMDSRLTTSLDLYYKLTRDAIFATTALASTGIDGRGVWGNYADILNQGVELSVGWNDKVGDLGYRVNANFTFNDNNVKAISAAGASYYDKGDDANNVKPLTRTMVGHSVGEFFGYRAIGVFQNQEEIDNYPHLQNTIPGHLKFEDVNSDGVIDEKDRVSLGSPNPPVIYGLNIGLDYKGLDFNLFCQGVAGNKIFNENRLLMFTTKNFDKEFFENRWHGEGTSTTYPSVLVKAGDPRTPNSFYVEDGSYFRIKNIQLGYTLPERVFDGLGIQSVRFYVNAENPVTFFKYNGFSPEVSSGNPLLSGVDNGVYPLSSVYSIGLNLNF
ncbi:TonB-dependent receptor [Sunxiuqinia rutila]|uniref:TonB-dependent receptor n=1 Tax=Sunxiuqinia rutila TaxID=1397841 RepID=UPI003D36545B